MHSHFTWPTHLSILLVMKRLIIAAFTSKATLCVPETPARVHEKSKTTIVHVYQLMKCFFSLYSSYSCCINVVDERRERAGETVEMPTHTHRHTHTDTHTYVNGIQIIATLGHASKGKQPTTISDKIFDENRGASHNRPFHAWKRLFTIDFSSSGTGVASWFHL